MLRDVARSITYTQISSPNKTCSLLDYGKCAHAHFNRRLWTRGQKVGLQQKCRHPAALWECLSPCYLSRILSRPSPSERTAAQSLLPSCSFLPEFCTCAAFPRRLAFSHSPSTPARYALEPAPHSIVFYHCRPGCQ